LSDNQATVEATTVATAGSVINTLTANASLIIREFFREAVGSPIIAVAASLITVDLLENQLKLLHPRTGTEIKLAVAALVGAEVVGDIAAAIEGGISVFTGKGSGNQQSLMPNQLATSTNDNPLTIAALKQLLAEGVAAG